MKKQKEEYKRLIKLTKKVIDEWDPIGLLAMGSPSDEYSIEISSIATVAVKDIDIDTLARNIQAIFIEYFGQVTFEKDICECREIAIKLKLIVK